MILPELWPFGSQYAEWHHFMYGVPEAVLRYCDNMHRFSTDFCHSKTGNESEPTSIFPEDSCTAEDSLC